MRVQIVGDAMAARLQQMFEDVVPTGLDFFNDGRRLYWAHFGVLRSCPPPILLRSESLLRPDLVWRVRDGETVAIGCQHFAREIFEKWRPSPRRLAEMVVYRREQRAALQMLKKLLTQL